MSADVVMRVLERKWEAWREDWARFAREALGVYLDDGQEEVLLSLQHNKLTSVPSGTARGKDFVAAVSALCFMYLTPRWNERGEMVENTKVVLTAPTDRQVKNIMMPEVARLWKRAQSRGVMLPGKLNAYDIRTGSEEWFLTGFKADEYNQEAWTGLHAVHILFLVTEASGISRTIFHSIEGNLQGDGRLGIFFNPNVGVGYAAESVKSKRWSVIPLNSLSAPNVVQRRIVIPGQVDYEWVRDKVEDWCRPIGAGERLPEEDDFEWEGGWYRPNDLFRVKVLGKFPRVSSDVLIPPQWVEEAVKRWRIGRASTEPAVLGVDVAGMGRDSTVYCERRGERVERFRAHNSGGRAEHMRIAGEVVSFLRREEGSVASIDTIGEGAGVYSAVEEQVPESWRVVSCKFSEAAKRRGRELTDASGQYRFVNMRAYLFWAVRDWLDPRNGRGAELPPSSDLLEEVGQITWRFNSQGRVIIDPKEEIRKRLGRSTDTFDALANTFYPVERVEKIDKAKLAKFVY